MRTLGIVMAGLVLLAAGTGQAAYRTTAAAGYWTNAATWDGGLTLPQAGDDVAISHAVTLDGNTPELGSFTNSNTLTFIGWETRLYATNVTVISNITHLAQSDTTGVAGVYADWTPDNRIYIVCSNLTVSAAGRIDADTKGYVAGTPSGASIQGRGPGGGGPNGTSDHGGGGSYGGQATMRSNGTVENRPNYGNPFAPTDPGSSGFSAYNYTALAKAGNGGGAIRIEASGDLAVSGVISADGQVGGPGGYTSGAGSGGSIFINCRTVTGTGSIRSRGGNGQIWSGFWTSGGGGGRVALLYDSAAQAVLPVPGVSLDVAGGFGGRVNAYGEPGSLYLSDGRVLTSTSLWTNSFSLYFKDAAAWNGEGFNVSNAWIKFPTNFPVTFTNRLTVQGAYGQLELLAPINMNGTDVMVTNSGRLYVYAGETKWPGVDYAGRVVLSGKLTIATNSFLYPYSHFSNGVPVKFEVGSLLVAGGGSFFAASNGYRGAFANKTGYGPPGGGGTTSDRSGGGGHGGVGGYSYNNNAGGGTYDSSNAPIMSGSCGGNGHDYVNRFGYGGGVIWVDAFGEVRVDGSLNANGGMGSMYGGGGAGGSIYVTAETFKGGGQLLAKGGTGGPGGGTDGGGGGGGGRIAVYSSFSSDWLGTYSVTNGTQGYTNRAYGTPGSYVFQYIVPARPGVSNAPVSSITTTTADLNGYLFTTGRYETTVFAYWGTTNQGDNAGLWQTVETFAAPQLEGPFSTNVSLPQPETMYFYRYAATNAGGTFWADDVKSFLAGHVNFDTRNNPAYREYLRPATVMVTRASTAVNGQMTVGYTVGGTAVPGVDYTALSGSVQLNEGVEEVPIIIQPLYRESPPEGNKTIELTLNSGNYMLGSSNAVSITLIELVIPPGPNSSLNSGVWTDIATWSLNRPPAQGDDVTIAHNLKVDVSVTKLASLTVESGKTLTFSGSNTCVTAETVTVYGTLTHITNTATAAPWTPDGRVYIVCSNFTLAAGGVIDLDGRGYQGGVDRVGYGPGGGFMSDWGGGGGHGGMGGITWNGTMGGIQNDSVEAPILPGSSGGAGYPAGIKGGSGGGVLRLDASGEVRIDGLVKANGAPSPYAGSTGGAGAGGSLYITCRIFNGNGSVMALGGTGLLYRADGRSGAGGGGRISIVYDTIAQAGVAPVPSIFFELKGGLGGPSPFSFAQPGSLYLSDASVFNPSLITNAMHLVISNRTTWTPSAITVRDAWFMVQSNLAVTVGGDVLVDGANGRFELYPAAALACSTLTVTNGASGYFYAAATNGSGPDYGGQVQVAGGMVIATNSAVYAISDATSGGSVQFMVNTLTINPGGRLSADGYGFRGYKAGNTGYGPGGGGATDVGAGAGYGGTGGVNQRGVAGGLAYGSLEEPLLAGSAGGRASGESIAGGPGGGLVWVEADQILVNGLISANGQTLGSLGGGGSGGGIYLSARRFSGTGRLEANGGAGGANNGWASGGGGGRIAVWRVNTDVCTTSVTGGPGWTAGSVGTVYWGSLRGSGTLMIVR